MPTPEELSAALRAPGTTDWDKLLYNGYAGGTFGGGDNGDPVTEAYYALRPGSYKDYGGTAGKYSSIVMNPFQYSDANNQQYIPGMVYGTGDNGDGSMWGEILNPDYDPDAYEKAKAEYMKNPTFAATRIKSGAGDDNKYQTAQMKIVTDPDGKQYLVPVGGWTDIRKQSGWSDELENESLMKFLAVVAAGVGGAALAGMGAGAEAGVGLAGAEGGFSLPAFAADGAYTLGGGSALEAGAAEYLAAGGGFLGAGSEFLGAGGMIPEAAEFVGPPDIGPEMGPNAGPPELPGPPEEVVPPLEDYTPGPGAPAPSDIPTGPLNGDWGKLLKGVIGLALSGGGGGGGSGGASGTGMTPLSSALRRHTPETVTTTNPNYHPPKSGA